MNIHQLKGRDLLGWRLCTGYMIETTHYLMGYLPAITTENKKIVVCLSRKDLEKVWNVLPKRNTRVIEFDLLFNEEEKIAVPTTDKFDPNNFFLAFGEDLENSLKEEHFFQWKMIIITDETDTSQKTFPGEEKSVKLS
jgi:hypothetical protein